MAESSIDFADLAHTSGSGNGVADTQPHPHDSSADDDAIGLHANYDKLASTAAAATAATTASPFSFNKSTYEVLRLDASGRTRKLYVRRRDLLREFRLQPRDLRRIDPTLDFTKTSPSITIKEDVLLLCMGGVRAIVKAEKALLFEPTNLATRRLVDTIVPSLRIRAEHGSAHPLGSMDSLPPHLAFAASQGLLPGGGSGDGGSDAQAISRNGGEGPPSGEAGYEVTSRRRATAGVSHSEYMSRFYSKTAKADQGGLRSPPFELEVLEGALIGATGRLDAELAGVAGRVQDLLTRLPADINPVSLEELRRVKAALVELEDKADNLRAMLEELMDDEDELRELNLSSRPRREERKRQRERERLERELERAREIKEELEGQLEEEDEGPGSQRTSNNGSGSLRGMARGRPASDQQRSPDHFVDADGVGYASWTAGAGGEDASASLPGGAPSSGRDVRQARLAELRAKFDRERLAELRAKFAWSQGAGGLAPGAVADAAALRDIVLSSRAAVNAGSSSAGRRGSGGGGAGRDQRDRDAERLERLERLRAARGGSGDDGDGGWISRLEQQLEGSEEELQDAQDALEEMVEAEEEEAELEEVEDLLEYYLQRTTATASEAERLLQGARDLEESISVSLSARRYEVNRLELTLSIGSFAAALGAMVAGIFGMNMRSMLEFSVASFWTISAAIVLGCAWVFVAIMKYTRARRIL